YLSLQIADTLGICANIDFPYPNEFLAQAFAAVLGPESDLSAFSGDRLTCAFLAAIDDPTVLSHPTMAPIRAYLADANGDRKATALARKVAALFERYATYRPDVAASWTAGADDGWESVIWRAIASRRPGHDIGTLANRFESALPSTEFTFPHTIAVFSVATLPPLIVRLLNSIAQLSEIHFFVLSPSATAWSAIHAQRPKILATPAMPTEDDLDLEVDHPLIASCGVLARDFQVSIERLDPEPIHYGTYVDPGQDTMLHTVQSDLLHARLPKPVTAPETKSVRLHSCHGPMRQVQALRDELLSIFDELPDLQPRDVIVMAPDIETFAPLIHAVFEDGLPWNKRHAHPGGLPQIPYRIADRGLRYENPAAGALLAILAQVGLRLKASDVLDLLAREPVRSRFAITADELPTIRDQVVECGIRWGADAEQRAAVGQPHTNAYTWRFGLDRLLLGQAMANDDIVFDALPNGEVEGKDERHLLGRFVDFAENLLEQTASLDQQLSLTTWHERLCLLVEAMIGAPEGQGWQIAGVLDGLANLADDAATAGFDGTLDLAAIRVLLEGRFSLQQPGQGFLSGAVTVCQLVPMRSIPFRVVCLLGMDDGAFPRISGRLAFDRMAASPRLGDRSVRNDDRALFLEALLSAQDRLVLFYTGHSQRSDRQQPPAVPVAELLDVLDARFITTDDRPLRKHLTTQHALQPFSASAFVSQPDKPPFGHDQRQLQAALAFRAGL
ncbi:MAG: exodeoxyribonuclease V subunit gamma, partial [Proteobacteria bacterium]|nr:exodeoxyribonuclease V subunit gamma [Pseudomonadota bacterium]